MKKDYINPFGLINPSKLDIVSENCIPTSVQYHNILVYFRGFDNHEVMEMRGNLVKYIEECSTGKIGLYNQYPQWYMDKDFFSNDKDKWTSKDQLQAMLCLLAMNGNYYLVYEINRYLRKHFNCYNNRRKFFSLPRWMGYQTRYLANYLGAQNVDDCLKLFEICHDQLKRDVNDPERSTGAMKAFTIESSIAIVNNDMGSLGELIDIFKPEIIEFYKEEEHPIRELLK